MHYEVQGFKGPTMYNQRNYTADAHDRARDFAKHLVEKCGCDSARVLTVESGETFYPSRTEPVAISSHRGQ